jgi:hypothetical protein
MLSSLCRRAYRHGIFRDAVVKRHVERGEVKAVWRRTSDVGIDEGDASELHNYRAARFPHGSAAQL